MILHMDNFGIYGTTTALLTQGVYVQQRGAELVTDPETGVGLVLKGGTIYEDVVRFAFPAGAVTTCGAAYRGWSAALPENDEALNVAVKFAGAGNQKLIQVGVTSNGRVRARLQNATDTAVDYNSAAPVVTANGWWHYEVKYSKTGTNTCDFEVRVEGQTVLQQTGVSCLDIQPAQCSIGTRINLAWLPKAPYFKDFVIWDGSGSYNNDFLGSVLVTNLTPTADVALNWTPSTGSGGYSILDNIPPNDAQYLSAGDPAPSPYVCELSNLPANITSVRALQTRVRAAKSDGGDGSLQTSIVSNGSTSNGSNRPITVTQTYWSDVFETDPDTGSPWLPSAVDDAELKLNRTA